MKSLQYFGVLTLILVLAFALLVSSCEKSGTVEFTDNPIIESYVVPDEPFSFYVQRQLPFDNAAEFSEDDIENLEILISYLDENYTLIPLDTGLYVDSSLFIAEETEVSFQFIYNGKVISGTTYVPYKPEVLSQSATSIYVDKIELDDDGFPGGGGEPPSMPDPVEITWDNPDGSYFFIVVENIETDPEPITEFDDEDSTFTRPSFGFRKTPTTSTFDAINSNEFEYFGTHRIILFHVLSDYAALYEDVNTSSQNLTNPSSNITNGYGIFTGLNSDTVYLEVREN